MHDQIVIADHSIHKAYCGRNLGHIILAPGESERVFDPAFHLHDLQERMIDQRLDLSIHQGMQVPELIVFDQVGIVARDDKFGIIFEEKIAHVVKVNQAIQFRRADAVLFTEFVAQQPGGLVHVMNELGGFRSRLGDMMIDDDPVGFIEARFESEIGHPAGFLAQLPLSPGIIVISFEWRCRIEDPGCQTLQ